LYSKKNRAWDKRLTIASEKLSEELTRKTHTMLQIIGKQTAQLLNHLELKEINFNEILSHPEITDFMVTNENGRIIATNNITWENTNIKNTFPPIETTQTRRLNHSTY